MRITKTTNFRKTTATTLLLSLLVPAISAAGQFDALYAGASEAEKSAIETWHQFYPGLEEQIQEAFRRGIDTGNFLFRSNKLPVAWNVDASRNIEVNSINVGYFRSLRNPSNHQSLFPGLTIDSQTQTPVKWPVIIFDRAIFLQLII